MAARPATAADPTRFQRRSSELRAIGKETLLNTSGRSGDAARSIAGGAS